MGAIFAIMRELNLSLFTFRYRGHMVDYTASTLCTAQCKFFFEFSPDLCTVNHLKEKSCQTQNVEILNLGTYIKITKNFKRLPKIRTEIPKN